MAGVYDFVHVKYDDNNYDINEESSKIREFLGWEPTSKSGKRQRPPAMIVVSGYREYHDYLKTIELFRVVLHAIRDYEPIILVGDCRGVDKYITEFATQTDMLHKIYPADWNANGKAAGPIRNKKMLQDSLVVPHHMLVAVDHPKSKGTKGIINEAVDMGISVIRMSVGDESQNQVY